MCPPEYLRDSCHGHDPWVAVVPPTIRDWPGLLPQDAAVVTKTKEDEVKYLLVFVFYVEK